MHACILPYTSGTVQMPGSALHYIASALTELSDSIHVLSHLPYTNIGASPQSQPSRPSIVCKMWMKLPFTLNLAYPT